IGVLLLVVGAGAVAAALARLQSALRTVANQLEALRGGDYSLRLRTPPGSDDFGAIMREANELADQLREQRLGAVEAAALVRAVIGEIDVALFAVDQRGTVRLANEAGARLLGETVADLVGKNAA